MYSQQVACAQALQESREFQSKLELKFLRRRLHGLQRPRVCRLRKCEDQHVAIGLDGDEKNRPRAGLTKPLKVWNISAALARQVQDEHAIGPQTTEGLRIKVVRREGRRNTAAIERVDQQDIGRPVALPNKLSAVAEDDPEAL